MIDLLAEWCRNSCITGERAEHDHQSMTRWVLRCCSDLFLSKKCFLGGLTARIKLYIDFWLQYLVFSLLNPIRLSQSLLHSLAVHRKFRYLISRVFPSLHEQDRIVPGTWRTKIFSYVRHALPHPELEMLGSRVKITDPRHPPCSKADTDRPTL